ncbi:MAG: twin-arginine translocase TatA/TatE family subunit, partial [Vicinamibacterales bacterium]|nr:twin-arginine translocase TatA/TatE family subunit [Vicinamibacterales bacterium]
PPPQFTASARRLAKVDGRINVSRTKEIQMGIGVAELLVIILIVLMIFGPNRLPALARGVGRGIKNFREATRKGDNRQN